MDVLRATRAQGKPVGYVPGEDEAAEAGLFEEALSMEPEIADVIVGVVCVKVTDEGAIGFTAAACDRLFGPGVRLCAACGTKRDKMWRCSACKLAFYCDESCQKRHRKNHKTYCKAIAAVHKRTEALGDVKEFLLKLVGEV